MIIFKDIDIVVQGSVRNKAVSFHGFWRKLSHTKTHQGTDKASKNDGAYSILRLQTGRVNFTLSFILS